MIQVQNLSFTYSPKTPFLRQALKGVDLDIKEGDFFGIIGSTGAGKSTLVNHFNALIRVQKNSGTVIVNGADLSAKKLDLNKLRAEVGMVFQYPEHQLFDDTVEKDVAFGPKNLGLSPDEQKARAKEAIGLVGLDYSEIAERSPFELSGGQKRRVALAGVIAMRPKVLVLDEPTAGLDPCGKKAIMELVLKLRSTIPTVVMISHNMDEVAAYCNRIAVLKDGKAVGTYTPRELFGSRDAIEGGDIRLPLITQIASGLNAGGMAVDPAITDEDELVDAIVKAVGHA